MQLCSNDGNCTDGSSGGSFSLHPHDRCGSSLPNLDFLKDGFGDGDSKKYFYCFVAEDQSQDKGIQSPWPHVCAWPTPLYEFFHLHSKGWRIIGYAFYFFVYSSWYGSQGLHLEDVYVEEECRRMLHVHQCTSCVHVGCDYTCKVSLSPSLALWSVSLRRRHWYWAYEALCQG